MTRAIVRTAFILVFSAVSIVASASLVDFIVCGPKSDRTHYLPEEVDTLSLLAHRTGSAYALLTLAASNSPIVRGAESGGAALP